MAHWYLANWLWRVLPIPGWIPPGVGAISAIDFRSDAACAQTVTPSGFGLFGFPTTQVIAGAEYFGDDLLANLNASRRTAWRNTLGIATALDNTRFDLIIAETLGQKSDPSGTVRAKPVIPTREGRLEIWLNGGKILDREFQGAADVHWPRIQAVEQDNYRAIRLRCLSFVTALTNAVQDDNSLADRLIKRASASLGISYAAARAVMITVFQEKYKRYLGALRRKYLPFGLAHTAFIPVDLTDEGWMEPETTLTENWTRADGTDIGNLLPWTETEAGWQTASNECKVDPGAGVSDARAEIDLSSADHYAQLVVTSFVGTASEVALSGVARFNASARTFYTAEFYSVENNAYIVKTVTGTRTTLAGPTASTVSVNDTLKCDATGTTIAGFRNGSSVLSVTDSSISGNLRTGIWGYSPSAASDDVRHDTFEASDGIATPPVIEFMVPAA